MAGAKKKELKDVALDKFKEFQEKVWPQTKKEVEKMIDNTKNMIEKGEQYLKEISDKGIEQTKKVSFMLKREKLYYDLGKIISTTPKTEWTGAKKINILIKEIKNLSKAIAEIE